MNQIYRALHMPPKRLIKKLSGQKEIYTIAVRRAPKGEGCDPLPALGEEPYTPLPYTPGKLVVRPGFAAQHRQGFRGFIHNNAVAQFAPHAERLHFLPFIRKLSAGRRGASEVPLCAAMPQNVAIAGIDPADLIGIHTYCRDADIEVIDARYLRKV